MIAKVAVDKVTYPIDKLYNYIVPEEFYAALKPGYRVLVPFGRGNKRRQALVFEVINLSGNDEFTAKEDIDFKKLKAIEKVLDPEPFIDEEKIKLAYFMKERYFCTFFDAIKVMVPPGAKMKIKYKYFLNEHKADLSHVPLDKKSADILDYIRKFPIGVIKEEIVKYFGKSAEKSLQKLEESNLLKKIETISKKTMDAKLKKVKLNENIDLTKLTKRQREVVDLLQEKFKDGAFLKEIQYYLGTSASVIENLEKKGFVNVFYEDFYRDPYKNRPFEVKKEEINLSVEQNEVYASLYDLYMKEKYEVSLLYGVTGSGKTSVFLKLVDKACKDNKGVIVMVPEIALTPQMVNLFKSRYGNKVAVFHSGLSAGERLDEYKKVKRNEANVVIGTRSAVFAPVKDLSLIVIDEEHETTYKSEQTPRYNAKEVAKFRCFHNNGLLILSSATPSVEDFYLAKNGRYHLHKISSRYSSAKLPEVSIVDMNLERENGNISSFSRFLIDELARNIENNQQSILLLNRRGYNTFISCRNCKEVISCPNCSISLIYHSANNRLMCHYCGHSTSLPQVCPRCKEPTIKYMGLGIQKAEEELKNLFPNAKILRMDSDSVAGKFSYEKKLNEFLSGNYQIMLGTQMISKGLNFPNVTLVGVLSSDQSLFSDDFRSYERTFSLLTQVIGRSGRFQKTGKAIIQTFSPEHLVINLAKKQDYEKFYNSEIKMRKAMLYPPFVNLCLVGFAATNEKNVLEISQDFLREFISLVKSEYINMPLKVLGPSPANILKLDNKFRYKIIIKCLNNKDFRNLISKLLIKFSDKKVNKNVSLYIDFNPEFVV